MLRGAGKNIGKSVGLRGFPVPASLVLPQGSAKEIEIIHSLFLVIAMYCQDGQITIECCYWYTLVSMTQLLTHSVAHSTKPSSRPKTNNQPTIKKFLGLAII